MSEPRAINSGNTSIRTRVALSVTLPLIILLLISALCLYALLKNSESLDDLDKATSLIQRTTSMQSGIQEKLLNPLYNVKAGSMDISTGVNTLELNKKLFNDDWASYLSFIRDNDAEFEQPLVTSKRNLDSGMEQLFGLLNAGEEQAKAKFVDAPGYFVVPVPQEESGFEVVDIAGIAAPLMSTLSKQADKYRADAGEVYETSQKGFDWSTSTIALAILGGLLAIVIAGILLYNSISRPVRHLTGVVGKLASGDTSARSLLKGEDELSNLGDTLNQMVSERQSLQTQVDDDNEALNTSVFSLLDAVADLSERDLTVRATVTEDATGPLADAINQLAEDTGDTLVQVRDIANAVESTAGAVNERARSVNALAQDGQGEARETAMQIDQIRERLESIARNAVSTNEVADQTSSNTQNAFQTVARSKDSMSDIRNTVQDTGKRIKRLGERSQEISYITDIINGIAERTTVLALNANMQAMAAGDAGKGFSVIADEIQRLAESSQESTEQISQLVKNIQQETKSTIATMDNAIEQVVVGSNLADEASRQMQLTLETTNQLTTSVNGIAEASKEQIEMGQALQARSSRIVDSSTATGQEMSLLTGLTQDMSNYAKQLVESVNIFKLRT